MTASCCIKCLARACLGAAKCLIGQLLHPSVSPRNAVPCRHAHMKSYRVLQKYVDMMLGQSNTRIENEEFQVLQDHVGHAAIQESFFSSCTARGARRMLWHSMLLLQLIHFGHDWQLQPLCSSVAFLSPRAVVTCNVRARGERLLTQCVHYCHI